MDVTHDMTMAEATPVGSLSGDPVLTIASDTPLLAVAKRLRDADVGALVVGTQRNVEGIVSERDVVKAAAGERDLSTTTAAEVATTALVWADAESSIVDVANEMLSRWVRHVLVEEEGRLVGIVSARDLLGALASQRG